MFIYFLQSFFFLFVFLLLNIYLISTVICLDYSEVKSLSVRKHSRKTSRKSLMLTCILSIRAPSILSNCLSCPSPLLPPSFISQWGKWNRVAQSCSTLCDPMDNSLPGSSVRGILQARILKWVAISFSRGSFQPRDQTHIFVISCIGRWILYMLRSSKMKVFSCSVLSNSLQPHGL